MDASGVALFETPVGLCSIAWRGGALVRVQLPEGDQGAVRARPSGQPPQWVAEAMARIAAMLSGEPDDLADLPLDFDGIDAFAAAVYRAAREIPPGRTLTYGELAARVGDARHARAVGQALGRNPWPIVVPCHRVTAADGRTGGFSAPGGRQTKLRLLEVEGALAVEHLPLFAGRIGSDP
jgi:methylated-DNA-[protein]-cysteine S-methyltransferase